EVGLGDYGHCSTGSRTTATARLWRRGWRAGVRGRVEGDRHVPAADVIRSAGDLGSGCGHERRPAAAAGPVSCTGSGPAARPGAVATTAAAAVRNPGRVPAA